MSGKRLLKGILAQTGSMNRLQEEREMWRLRKMEKTSHWGDYNPCRKPRSMISRGRLLSDSLSSPPPPPHHHHHSTSPHHSSSRTRSRDYDHTHFLEEDKESDSYWTRQLLKQEEEDPDRWGHSGYRELYAEEFVSSEESDIEQDTTFQHGKIKNGHSRKRTTGKDRLSTSGKSKGKRKRCDSSDSSREKEVVRKKKKTKKKLKDGETKRRKTKTRDGKKKSGKHKHTKSV